MVLIKIHYSNCEEEGYCELQVTCKKEEYDKVKKIISDFKKKHSFFTSAHNFVNELEKFGFKANEIKYPIEV